ncbi:hypothetical protein QMK19_18740 [Streptomyces sp. H10-C2]|uniref:hypothetical protein n=1 Tax=unclassified Streptomyces TaxID=2593676 RepID=UPI0024B94572|nr:MULTISPECIES: hypothetical protein [unclassified Streptomyces]MDJ0340820.1 hypothetical protein [Streptomyces sp. PH10-H1]MDJ0371660.1 hypothetical protein [Streptomyces sp. H10-C2]
MRFPEEQLAVLRAAHPDGEAESPADWLAEIGGTVEAIPYRWLYWPEVFELSGAVFVDLYGAGEAEIARRLAAAVAAGGPGRGSQEWTELVDGFNFFEISQLFRQWRGPLDASEEAGLALAGLLVEPWRGRLRAAFPGREFGVRISPPQPELGVCVEVTQSAPDLHPPAGW